MDVPHLDLALRQKCGEILSHFLREHGDHRTGASFRCLLGLTNEVSYLSLVTWTRDYWPHNYLGVYKSCRTDNHLDGSAASFELILSRRSRSINDLAHARFEFLERERSIIDGAWQSESVLDQRIFSCFVSRVHSPYLRHRNM